MDDACARRARQNAPMPTLPRLAYLGPEGTYTHQAALSVPANERLPARSIRAVFEAVLSGKADAGVVPGENVLEGGVGETLDSLLTTTAVVVGELVLPIEHCLVGRPGKPILRVYSHPQALAQCGAWLDQHLPQADRIDCASTGEAAALAATDPEGGTIVPGARAGLQVLARGLAQTGNRTRFFVIAPRLGERSGRDRTLVAFQAPHRPGSLHACLTPLAQRGINLSRIESRPARAEAWTYHFVIEIEGHPAEERVAETLGELRAIALDVRILGAWPVPA
jgi:chorismate mutase/prephenate dehydratase